MDTRSRTWFLTCNNPCKADEEAMHKSSEMAEYALTVHEVGKKRGTPHMHCWLHFKTQRTFRSIKKMHPRTDIKVGKGTDQHSKTYLSKENEPKEYGTMHSQGKRTDIDIVRDCIKETNSMREVVEIATSYQAVRFAELYLKYAEKPRPYGPRKVIWYWGDTGTGKSYTANQNAPGAYSTKSFKWWDGYDGEKEVILDEIRGDFCKFHEMLTLLGEMPYRVESKGGSRQALCDTIYITSHDRPECLWQSVEDKSQLMDRISEIVHFEGQSRRREALKNDSEDLTQKSGVIIDPVLSTN